MRRALVVIACFATLTACSSSEKPTHAKEFRIDWKASGVSTKTIPVRGDVEAVQLGGARLKRDDWVCLRARGGSAASGTDGEVMLFLVGKALARYTAERGHVRVEVRNAPDSAWCDVEGEVEITPRANPRAGRSVGWSTGSVFWTS